MAWGNVHAVVLIGLVLAGCNTTGINDGPDVSIAQPYELSEEQQELVRQNLQIYLTDPSSSEFGPMLAGQFPNGQIMICGHIRAGVFKTWTAYSAYASGQRVWMGNKGSAAIAICRDRNIPIKSIAP